MVTTKASMFLLLAVLLAGEFGIDSIVCATEKSDGAKVSEPLTGTAKGKNRPLRRLIIGTTPEEQARLEEERKRLSATAASFGTDPTAIIGFYQINYGHSAFTNPLHLDTATATVRLPVTPNLIFQANMPYVWVDPNQRGRSTMNGAGDMTARIGGRVYTSEYVALFIGSDAWFPTASEKPLGTGKYLLGPGGAAAVPLARLHSLFFVLVEDFNTVGGDPGRTNLHFMQVQSTVNTIWSQRWWSSAVMTLDIDWNNNRKTTMNLLGEIGHRLTNHWNVFAGAGGGVLGRQTFLGLDWTVQAGVRWMFTTPLFSKTIVEEFKGE